MISEKHAYLSKLSIPGNKSEELSYIFTDSINIDSHQRIYIFGIFLCTSQKEEYQIFIKETVDAFLDFYHKSLVSYKNVLDTAAVDSHEFLFESAIKYTHDHLLKNSLLPRDDNSPQLDFKKIHFTLGALAQDHVYVSGSGSKIFGYYIYPIFSKNHGFSHYTCSPLIDGNQENDRSNKLFSYLINGPVSLPGGSLCILNKALLDYLSLEQIRHILTNNPCEKVSSYIHTLLSKINSKHDFSALFINPSYHGPAIQNLQHIKQTVSSRSMAGLNLTESGTEQVLSPTFKPMVKNTFFHFYHTIQSGGYSLFTHTKNLVQKIPHYFHQIKNFFNRCSHTTQTWYQIIFPRVVRGATFLYHAFNTFFHAILILVKQGPRAFFTLIQGATYKTLVNITSSLHSFKNKGFIFLCNIWQYFQKLSPRSKALLSIGSLFLVLFIISIGTLYSKQLQARVDSRYDQQFLPLERMYTNLESRILYEQGEQIQKDLLALEQQLQTLRNSFPQTDNRIDKLQDRITLLKQKIFFVLNIENPRILATLPLEYGQLQRIIPLQKMMLVISPSHIMSYDYIKKIFEPLPFDEQSSTICGSYFSETSAFICSQDLERLFVISAPKYEITPYELKKNNREKSITSFATYNNKLYALDPESNMIYRHVVGSENFETGSNVLPKNLEELTDGKKLAIDGSLFVLTQHNTILKITKGKPTVFTIPVMSPPLSNLDSIITHEDTPYLLLLDSEQHRIIILDKMSGKLIIQLTSPQFEDIHDISLKQDGKELYVLTNTKILVLPIKEFVKNP